MFSRLLFLVLAFPIIALGEAPVTPMAGGVPVELPGMALPAPSSGVDPSTPLPVEKAPIVGADTGNKAIASLMFDPEIAAEMDAAVREYALAHMNDQGADDFLSSLNQNTEASVEFSKRFPTFYLSSIVYSSTGDWSVWVDGVRFTPKSNDPKKSFHILTVTPRYVVIEWKPIGIAADLNGAWERQKGAVDRYSVPGSVAYNQESGVVHFRLLLNQTFISRLMQVREGRYTNSVILTTAP